MRKWVMRLAVPVVATAGALAVASGPALAGGWVNGGVYSTSSLCNSTGQSREASGQYQSYTCTLNSNPRGYLLRGYVS